MKPLSLRAVTVVGGTGTLGRELMRMITNEWPGVHITCVSRDEQKHARLKREFPRVNFRIGDITRIESVAPHLVGRDVVFHVAAMKHVDICELNPKECDTVNLEGTVALAHACINARIKHMVFSSTDKAVDPINHYGRAKASAENHLRQLNSLGQTKFSVYRWGNVLGSEGSAIPLFVNSLIKEKKVYLTHPDMTRFWIPIEWAVRYMLRTFPEAKLDEAMIPPIMKSSTLVAVFEALADLLDIDNYETVITGVRPGEKIHEAMYSLSSGRHLTSESSERYTHQELMDLLRPFTAHIGVKAA